MRNAQLYLKKMWLSLVGLMVGLAMLSQWEHRAPTIYALLVLGSPRSWAGGTVLQPRRVVAEGSWGADPRGAAGLGSDPNSAWWSQSAE